MSNDKHVPDGMYFIDDLDGGRLIKKQDAEPGCSKKCDALVRCSVGWTDGSCGAKLQGSHFPNESKILARIRELLTEQVLIEIGSEQHEIMNPDHADEIRGLLHRRPHLVRTGPFSQ